MVFPVGADRVSCKGGGILRYLELTRGYRAKVDDEDYARLNRRKWHTNMSRGQVYAARCVMGVDGKQKKRMLHYEVLGLSQPPEKGKVVDHINGDSLDCRKVNLRVVSVYQNRWNTRPVRRKCASRYKGVSWQRPKGPFKGGWQATIMCRGRRRYLGFFRREYEAVVAFNRAAARLQGKYAWINRWRGPSRAEDRARAGYEPREEETVRWVRVYEHARESR